MSGEHPLFPSNQEHQRLLSALRESEILRELVSLLASSLDLNHILQVLAHRTTEVCNVGRCSVWLIDKASNVLRPVTYYLSSQHLNHKRIQAREQIWYRSYLPLMNPMIAQIFNERGMLAVEDLHTIPSMHTIAKHFFVHSIFLVALVREGRPVGMLSLDDPGKSRSFSPEFQQLVRSIGQQAAIAIDNAQLYQQAQTERQRAERLIGRAQAIYQVAMAVNSGEELSTVLGIALHHLVNGLNAHGGAIALLEGQTLHLASTTHLQPQLLSTETTVSITSLPNCIQILRYGTPLFISIQHTEGIEQDWYRRLGLENVMIVPLLIRANHQIQAIDPPPIEQLLSNCIGFAFINYADPAHRPARGHYAFAQDIAAQCALAVEKAHLLADAHQAATLATERANTLDAVFQAMTEGISVLNQNGEVMVRNVAAARFLDVPVNFQAHLNTFLSRYPTYTLQGQPIAEEDYPLTRALRGERIRGERFIIKARDGVKYALELNVSPLYDSSQQQIGTVNAFRDVTQQVVAEQRIRQTLEMMLDVAEAVCDITEIQLILRTVLERTLSTLHCEQGSIHFYIEEQHLFTPVLSAGISPEEAVEWFAQHTSWLNSQTPAYQDLYSQIINGSAVAINAKSFPDMPATLRNTRILVVPIVHHNRLLGLLTIYRSSPPAPLGIHQSNTARPPEFSPEDKAIVEGITQLAGLAIEQARWQQEATEARMREAEMRAESKQKDEFLAITAHEFRNPLTVIQTSSQYSTYTLNKLLAGEAENQKWHTTAQKILKGLADVEKQTHLLSNIVNTFLEASQINQGQLSISLIEVNVAELVEQAVAHSRTTSGNQQINCQTAPSKRPYLIKGDVERLQQVIGNLLENAIKYSPAGEPIAVSLRQCESTQGQAIIEMCVEDKGIGIPLDVQSRLFERFYRAPGLNVNGKKVGGMGLGLYIVAELLRLHGGSIRVESSGMYGKGSRFLVTLPLLERNVVTSDMH